MAVDPYNNIELYSNKAEKHIKLKKKIDLLVYIKILQRFKG